MVRQQRGLNIQPQPRLQPSFLLPVYFCIMALFQKEKHVLHWDAQGCLTTCFHQFFFNLSASPISWGVGLPESWVLALAPFSCRDYPTLEETQRGCVCSAENARSKPRSFRNSPALGKRTERCPTGPGNLEPWRAGGEKHKSFTLLLGLCARLQQKPWDT